MIFWSMVILLALGLCAFVLQPLFRDLHAPITANDSDLELYKAQLAQLDRDTQRGQLDAEAAQDLRLEISRRILALDPQHETGAAQHKMPRTQRMIWLVGLAAVLFAGSTLIYLQLGQPGLPDYPLAQRRAEMAAQRPSQTTAEAQAPSQQVELSAEFETILNQLRDVVKNRPNDATGLRLLAEAEASTRNFSAAHRAQNQLIRLLGDAASASDYVQYSEYLIFAANGVVTQQANTVLNAALSRDPDDFAARYYMGLGQAQIGRPDLTYHIWSKLLRDAPSDAPWRDLIDQDLPAIAAAAGIKAPLPGPSAQDVQAAEELSEADRMEMIETMVEGLAQRLASQGGSAAEWARLIRALGVLGETKRASAIWAEAQVVFANDSTALAQLRAAAQAAEVAQ